jgi:NADH-quinone oxidoreductase subunit H
MGVGEFLANFFVNVGRWLTHLLVGWGVAPGWAEVIVRVMGALVIATLPILSFMFLVWEARKVIARMQDRIGPNNSGTYAGPYALFQTAADGIKMLTKEIIIPEGADTPVFIIAPILVVTVAIAVWAVIPFGPAGMQGVDLGVGVFYVVAVSSLSPFSMIMAGWSSRNKYADVGAFRAVSQIISYEVPQVLALLVPVMLSGSMALQEIVIAQEAPYIIALPLPALIYFLAATAELGRLPFDLAEADSEIVAGYFTEYSGMMFGAFYLAEFISNFSVALVFSVLFLGGWRGPGVETVPVLGGVWLLLKGFLVFNVFILFWAAMPRLRIDQILALNWKFLVPLGVVTLCVVAVADKVILQAGVATPWGRALWLLLVNVLLALATIVVLHLVEKAVHRRQQEQRLAAVRG